MSESSKAVFLSYASQDAAAVERIAEALRAAGVEVWFDRDELVGGDAWDQKIRRQIKECALFVPVISANTNARAEGYFRLEWKLAVDRSHLMADDAPFLFPVVIDDTSDAAARVPERFREVQWTRLSVKDTPTHSASSGLETLAVRVGELLGGGGDVLSGNREALGRGNETVTRSATKRGPAWLRNVAMIGGLAIGLVYAVRPMVFPTALQEKRAARAQESAAESWIRQAREMVYDADAARHEFALAEALIKRATEVAPDSGEAWGVSALLQQYFATRAYDADSKERLRRAREQAEKALRLAPNNVDALLALGLNRASLAGRVAGRPFLEKAATMAPDNPKVVIGLSGLREPADRIAMLCAAAESNPQPAELWYYAASSAVRANRVAEGRSYLERARSARPLWRVWVAEAHVEYFLTADAERVEAWLRQVPELRRDDPRVVFFQWRVALLRGDGTAALRAVGGLTEAFIEDNFFSGPKALLQAQAHEAAGQPERAKEQWSLAARLLREKLAGVPGEALWQAQLALALADVAPAQAREMADAVAAGEGEFPDTRRWREIDALEYLAQAYARLGELTKASAALRRNRDFKGETGVSQAMLARERRWDSLRGQPEFEALLAEAKARVEAKK